MEYNSENQFIFLFFSLRLLIVNYIGLPLAKAWWDLVNNSSQFAFAIWYMILYFFIIFHIFLYVPSSVPTISLPNEELKNILILTCDIDCTNETFFFFFLNEIMLKIIVIFILDSYY